MLSGAEPHYQRYKTPRGNNQSLVVPPLDQLDPRPPCPGIALAFGDVTLSELRATARDELLAAAARYTASYCDLPAVPEDDSALYLTGHQAELFHPGVWFKNFMLSRLATEQRAVGVHLVIDTDVMHRPGIRVPTGSVVAPRVETVPLDVASAAVPLEERSVVDQAMFASFGERVQQTITPLVADPLVAGWWPTVVDAATRTGRLGLGIAQARHQLEREWSVATLELPMSEACSLPSFRHFAAALLLDARRVGDAYNQSLVAYRQAHRLRNDAQPMPNLSFDGEWCEMPFWVWTADQPTRRPLMARVAGSRLSLGDRDQWQASVEVSGDDSHQTVVNWLGDLADAGVKIRTRALTTTLFTRLVLGDLFLHGIGGAKYDEVTDDLARRLWGCPPPPFATCSATMHLPIEHSHTAAGDLRDVRRRLRDCQWHPERFVDASASSVAKQALADKQEWIRTAKTPENAATRHQAIAAANAILRGDVEAKRHDLELQERQTVAAARATAILESREYAFGLFPTTDLRERMWRLVENS